MKSESANIRGGCRQTAAETQLVFFLHYRLYRLYRLYGFWLYSLRLWLWLFPCHHSNRRLLLRLCHLCVF